MNDAPDLPSPYRPARWAVAVAFALVYTAWGTTYLAIKAGVKTLPPGLFGGTRVCAAGLCLLGYLVLRGERLALPRRDLLVAVVAGLFLFVGGNGLITVAEKTVDSGVAAVLVATTPVWIALLETAWPWGERLGLRGWLGILVGLTGVLVLLTPRLADPGAFLRDTGPLLVLGSALCWSAGSIVLRYGRRGGSHLVSAAVQMIVGGSGQALIGLLYGEAGQLRAEVFTPQATFAFFYLLVVGSLVGFLAFTWLLQHVSATRVGTYAYVNPAVAVLVGWLLGGEEITGWIVGGLVVILAGVALVRTGAAGARGQRAASSTTEPARSSRATLASSNGEAAIPSGTGTPQRRAIVADG
jgi:drug/metabolite transporter (DMT)-like permease